MSPGYEGQVFTRWEDAWELGSSRAFFPFRKIGVISRKAVATCRSIVPSFGKLRQLNVTAQRDDLDEQWESFAASILMFPGMSVLAPGVLFCFHPYEYIKITTIFVFTSSTDN